MHNKQWKHQRGFTLIEMIGVLAIIAILAAVIAPKVFDAISDSRVDSLVEEINTVRTAVASFYKDTGRFPNQYSASTGSHWLTSKPQGVTGWRGPYLDNNLTNPVNPNGVFNVNAGPWKFDIDGDGTDDYGTGTAKPTVSMAWFNMVTAEQAKAISNIIDGDGNSANWFSSGRVRTASRQDPGGSSNVTLYVFLAGR